MNLSKILVIALLIVCSNARAALITLNSGQYLELQLKFTSPPLKKFDSFRVLIGNITPIFYYQNPVASLYSGGEQLGIDSSEFFSSGAHFGRSFEWYASTSILADYNKGQIIDFDQIINQSGPLSLRYKIQTGQVTLDPSRIDFTIGVGSVYGGITGHVSDPEVFATNWVVKSIHSVPEPSMIMIFSFSLLLLLRANYKT